MPCGVSERKKDNYYSRSAVTFQTAPGPGIKMNDYVTRVLLRLEGCGLY